MNRFVLLLLLFAACGLARPASAATPTWAGDIPESARNAILEEFPYTSDWLVRSPRIDKRGWTKGVLGNGKHHREYHFVHVNFLDRLNMNRDGFVVLVEDRRNSGKSLYRVIDSSKLWLSRPTLSNASMQVPDLSVIELSPHETLKLSRNFAWYEVSASNRACNSEADGPCERAEAVFQFRLTHERLVLIGHTLKVISYDASHGEKANYSCSINYLTRTKLERGSDGEEKKTILRVRPLSLREFVPYPEKYAAGGLPMIYFCDRMAAQ